jgi:hypothetical protein
VTRNELLLSVIGKPWQANARGPDAWDCFHLARHIERELAGRDIIDVEVPRDPSWAWMIDAIERHPDRKNWREIPVRAGGLVKAADLSIVLMARTRCPAHVGVWLQPEGMVIHAEQQHETTGGVVCDTLADLHMKSWRRLRFFEPVG